MAWYKRYRIPFQSLGGDQYVVYIYEQTSGRLDTLTGSANPFVTQEDYGDNIFEPIRKQTGYLRVIDETQDGSLLESLIPSNNTEKLVRLYFGEYVNGTFNDANLLWSGFLCAEAFTQPWDKQKKELEFPVKSIVAALEDVYLPESSAPNTSNVAKLFVDAFNALGETPRTVYVISNLEDIETNLLAAKVENRLFFDSEEVQSEGDTTKRLIGKSYSDAIEEVMQLFGMTVRMHNNILYISMYDNGAGKIGLLQFASWSNFVDVSQESHYGGSITGVGDVTILSQTFAGIDNVAGFVQGGKEAVVRLKIENPDYSILELPLTSEDQSTAYEIGNIYPNRGQVFVQPHDPRTLAVETYAFYEYQSTGYQPNPANSLYALVGSSNYTNCLNNSVVMRPDYKPLYSTSDHLHTGAFPCRWLYKKDSNSQPQYKNGMFLNQMFLKENVQGNLQNCYSLESSLAYTLKDGYLHIDMQCLNFKRSNINGEDGYLTFGEFISQREQGKMPTTSLYFILSIGNYFWDGTNWVTGVMNNFEITFYGDNIESNKTTEMMVDETGGWFVPVPSTGMYGKVCLRIVNASRCLFKFDDGTTSNYFDNHSKIITDLSVEFLPNINPMASRRTSNTYRQQILSGGFSGEEAIDLSIGTYNNNIPSDSFIKSKSNELVETLPYYYDGGIITDERPERNLLERMVEHYGQVRRTFKGILKSRFNPLSSVDQYQYRYTYVNRNFFAVEARHDWREDTQEVKFIEVT